MHFKPTLTSNFVDQATPFKQLYCVRAGRWEDQISSCYSILVLTIARLIEVLSIAMSGFGALIKRQNLVCSVVILIIKISIQNSFIGIYFMAVSQKDWELPNARNWLAEINIESGLDFPI